MAANEYVIYEVRFRGVLDPRWADWFDGLSLTTLDNGDTLLRGPVCDQSELSGVLEKIASLTS